MPNHVMNRVSMSGNPETIGDLLVSIQDDKKGVGTIDFNKIIPMPESLDIEAGSNTDLGLKAYTGFIQIYNLGGTRTDADMEHIPAEAEKAFLRMRTDVTPEQWELGKKAYENQSKYGAPTWYEWSVNNWGTKWNAYECAARELGTEHSELSFWTAWSPPHPVLQRLSEQHPDITIEHEWADEQIGMNCGRRLYSDGCMQEENIPFGDEAVMFARGIWEIDQEEGYQETGGMNL